MLDNMKISAFISEKRKQKGLTQQQIADQLHVSSQAVSKWENGTTYPNTEALYALAQMLGVTADEILNARESDHVGLTYSKAGIDVSYLDTIKKEMAKYIGSSDPCILNGMGPFASLYELKLQDIEQPVLVLKAEEPGSKQKLAFKYGFTESICHDMINHLVNDIAVMGARPLAVLDTIICGNAEKDTIKSIVNGISEACIENECSLVGGETSIQPNVVAKGVYILSSSVAGIVDKNKIIDGTGINEGDAILAVASNGLHTNGYTLVRLLMEEMPQILNESIDGESFINAIMKPHTPYYKSIKGIVGNQSVKGLAHITGGGIAGNLSRIIPDGLCAHIDLAKIKTLGLFKSIKFHGSISDDEMLATFNCGVGLIIVVRKKGQRFIQDHLAKYHVCYEIGEITRDDRKVIFRNKLKW